MASRPNFPPKLMTESVSIMAPLHKRRRAQDPRREECKRARYADRLEDAYWQGVEQGTWQVRAKAAELEAMTLGYTALLEKYNALLIGRTPDIDRGGDSSESGGLLPEGSSGSNSRGPLPAPRTAQPRENRGSPA